LSAHPERPSIHNHRCESEADNRSLSPPRRVAAFGRAPPNQLEQAGRVIFAPRVGHKESPRTHDCLFREFQTVALRMSDNRALDLEAIYAAIRFATHQIASASCANLPYVRSRVSELRSPARPRQC